MCTRPRSMRLFHSSRSALSVILTNADLSINQVCSVNPKPDP